MKKNYKFDVSVEDNCMQNTFARARTRPIARPIARDICIQDTLSSRAALGLPAAAFRPSASREQRYLAYKRDIGYLVYKEDKQST